MVSVAGGSNMMAGLQLSGIAESGWGVRLGGFHCPTIEFAARLEDLKAKLDGPWTSIVSHEENGHVTFLACTHEDRPSFIVKPNVETYRREPHRFFLDLPKFLLQSRATDIEAMTLTGSLGSVSLTIIYRPTPNPSV